ncbi:MAG: 1-acyl-sn-glycerol-3-phosphate acyltransferase [Deltaproteobacteria bacterium]|nr:1-acyl-sn-glycerol-3-phosphate acyltransferase [Deltaproteobacteria bacterium]
MDTPVFLVPQLVAYGRRREKKDKSLAVLLFGQTENPGTLRRVITFFRLYHKAFVVSCEPVNLSEFLEIHSGKSREAISYLLRREIIDRIDEEKRTIVGPVLKSREEIAGIALRDPGLIRFMEEMAATGKEGYGTIVDRANGYLLEIAAGYNDTYIGFMDKVLTWLWDNIYDGVIVDKEGLARMREVSKKMPFVVIPCHRSHMDYLLIHYVFYYNNIQLPFIAAGANLSFWPLGYFARNLGAFFIRRTIGGNALYGEALAKYVKTLLAEGFPIEFFIEGGRSRTGKMVMPKYGLFSMIMQAYRESHFDDLAIIPVFVGYDRVVEERSYLKELGGRSKEKEKISSLLKSINILKKRYGGVYMNVGEPMLLKSYLASQETPIEEMTLSERRILYRKMGYEVVNEINEVSVVTPFSLVAAGLLSYYRRGISHDDLMEILNEFYDYLDFRGVRFSSTFANREKALNDALGMFESSGFISRMGPEEGDEEDELAETIYSVDEDRRLNIEYYKNNILHSFVSLSFVSTSLLSNSRTEISLSEVMEDYDFFKALFMDEFIYDNKVDDREEVQRVLSYARDRGMIILHEDADESMASIAVTGKGRTSLPPFAGLVQNYLESYWIASRGLTYLKGKGRQKKDLIKKIHKLGVKMYKKGEISKTEALSQSNYKNALKFLLDYGAISMSSEGDGEGVRIFSLADKGRLETLRRKLFNFMR